MKNLTSLVASSFFALTIGCVCFSIIAGVCSFYIGDVLMDYEVAIKPVVRWSFFVSWALTTILGIVALWVIELHPAWRLKRKYCTDLQFAIKHRHSTPQEISFFIQRPIGYWPWGGKECRQWCAEQNALKDSGILEFRRK